MDGGPSDDVTMETKELLRAAMALTNRSLSNGSDDMDERHRQQLVMQNDQRAITLLPAMLFVGLLMVVGILGNSAVCYVFLFRLKSSTQNLLFVFLAVFDLLSCCVAMPTEIVDMRYYFLFESELACKLLRFILAFCVFASIMTLVVIAVDRFRKVCRPLSPQMSVREARLAVLAGCGVAGLASGPALLLYGRRTALTQIPGVVGSDCSTSDAYLDKVYPLLYEMFQALGFFVLTTALVVIYVKIWREIRHHRRYLLENTAASLAFIPTVSEASTESCPAPSLHRQDHAHLDHAHNDHAPWTTGANSNKNNSNRNNNNNGNNNNRDSNKQQNSNSNRTGDGRHRELERLSQGAQQSPSPVLQLHVCLDDSDLPVSRLRWSTPGEEEGQAGARAGGGGEAEVQRSREECRESSMERCDEGPAASHAAAAKTPSQGGRAPAGTRISGGRGRAATRAVSGQRTTVIAFLVTCVFVCSFLPHLSLLIARSIDPSFDHELEGASLVAFNVFLRSYFVNNAANPVIYGLMNLQFRRECLRLLRCLCCPASSPASCCCCRK